jgi:hypothetical protein
VSTRLLRAAGAAVLTTALLACSSKTTSATVSSCQADPGGGNPKAEGQVTNDSSKDSAFVIRIGFYDSSGNRVSDGADSLSGVGAHTSAPWHVTGATSAKGPLTCKVLDVRRTAVPGS